MTLATYGNRKYHSSALGEAAEAVRMRAASLCHTQPGDPGRLADVVVEFANVPNPPVRLPLGSDTVAAIQAKHDADAAILSGWRHVSIATDFPT